MKVFGQGTGVAFPAPAVIAADVCRFYGVREIGRTSAVRERYYAISAERRLKHPGRAGHHQRRPGGCVRRRARRRTRVSRLRQREWRPWTCG